MDSGSTIIGIILLLLCAIPLGTIYYRNVQKSKDMLAFVKQAANSNNCKLTRYEYCGNFLLGLGQGENNFLFYIRKTKNDRLTQVVNLSAVEDCHVLIKERKLDKLSIVELVELSFPLRNKKSEPIRIELYKEEESFQVDGEVKVAKDWAVQIKDHIK